MWVNIFVVFLKETKKVVFLFEGFRVYRLEEGQKSNGDRRRCETHAHGEQVGRLSLSFSTFLLKQKIKEVE